MKTTVPIIKELPKEVQEKIAAGQVVERPASVVKELLENALDAGAEHIVVRLTDGGLKKIVIFDDGYGIPQSQLLLAVSPHATSKISSLEQFEQITTFGFRGEALASIAAVATVTIQSRERAASIGAQLHSSAGVITQEGIGMQQGTLVTVENIFSRVPARRKFMKTAQAEYRVCLKLIETYAVIFPQLSLQLFHNEKQVLNCIPQSLKERLAEVWGAQYKNGLLAVSSERGVYQLHGFCARPELAKEHTLQQLFTINGRPVQSPVLKQAIKEAYGILLSPKKNPSYVLDLVAPPEILDVNCDPRKERVELLESEVVKTFVLESIQETLRSYDLQFNFERRVYPYSIDQGLADVLKHGEKMWSVKDIGADTIAQLLNVYLVLPVPTGAVLIDQHAAHERILYDQLSEQYRELAAQGEQAVLNQSVVIPLSQSELTTLRDHLEVLEKIGFACSIHECEVEITAVPKYLERARIKQHIEHIISELIMSNSVANMSETVHRTLAYVACRSAIKAGEPLTTAERYNLVVKLAEASESYTCPHGRPVSVHISQHELERLFERA